MKSHSIAMTGKDLLVALQAMSEEDLALPVHFAHPSHDHWRTELAGEITMIQPERIAYSDYHDTFRSLDNDQVEEAERVMRGAMEEGASVDGPLMYANKPVLEALVVR